MSNSSVLIRSLVIYGICLPLAIGIGYMLSTPMSYASFSSVLLVLGLLLIPILLRWHYPWLVAAWNLNAVVFVLHHPYRRRDGAPLGPFERRLIRIDVAKIDKDP